MDKPKIAFIRISWVDSKGDDHVRTFSENNLEEAETLIGLMTGNITEEDLKP